MSIPFIPVSPRQVAQNIATKMGFVRQGLMAKGEYLADPAIVDRVGWEPHGLGHRLILLPPPSASPNTRQSTPFPDGSDTATTDPSDTSPPNPTDVSSEHTDDMPADPLMPATLAIVTQLVPGQSWLYPDGRWTGPTFYVKKFTDTKLLCTGGAATHPRFVNDYATAIGNLNAIMSRVGEPQNSRNTVVSGSANHLRARHPLFMVCPISFWLPPSMLISGY